MASVKVFLMPIFITIIFLCSNSAEVLFSDYNEIAFGNIVDILGNLSLQLKEVQGKVTNIEEHQVKIAATLEGLQQCSTKGQIAEFQELVFRDDCEEVSHVCSDMGTCIDYFNRYECSCLPGYSGDGFTCQDVDECRENLHHCSGEKVCVNNPGSYECQNCPRFFKKMGYSCQGPVCESPSLFLQEVGCLTEVKENIPWDVAKARCQELGGRLANGLQRKHLQALSSHLNPEGKGYWLWVGMRRRQWIHEEEEEESTEVDWVEGEPDGYFEECGVVHLLPSALGFGGYPCTQHRWPLCQSLP